MTTFVNKALPLPDVFANVAKRETVDEKAKLLARYDSKALRWYVAALYSSKFAGLDIPDFKYNKTPSGITFMTIQTAAKNLDTALRFRTNPKTVERMLVLALESVSKAEAELLLKLLRGERKIEGVSKSVFKRVYPQFFKEEKENEQAKA